MFGPKFAVGTVVLPNEKHDGMIIENVPYVIVSVKDNTDERACACGANK